jgi:hypothetical protein
MEILCDLKRYLTKSSLYSQSLDALTSASLVHIGSRSHFCLGSRCEEDGAATARESTGAAPRDGTIASFNGKRGARRSEPATNKRN